MNDSQSTIENLQFEIAKLVKLTDSLNTKVDKILDEISTRGYGTIGDNIKILRDRSNPSSNVAK